MLELQSVTRLARREAVLERASLAFSRNAPTAVLGLSLEARPAFLRVVSGLDQPQSGQIKLDGQNLKRPRGRSARLGWIGQGGLPPSSRVLMRLFEETGRPKPSTSELALHAKRFGLEGVLDRRLRELSLDQRIRAAIALARAAKPSFIL